MPFKPINVEDAINNIRSNDHEFDTLWKSSEENSCLKNQNLKLLDEFETLKYGWDGKDAPPIPHETIETARQIIKMASVQPEIFATLRGSVQLEYEDIEKKSYFEIEVCQDRFEIYSRIGANETEYALTVSEDVIDRIMRHLSVVNAVQPEL